VVVRLRGWIARDELHVLDFVRYVGLRVRITGSLVSNCDEAMSRAQANWCGRFPYEIAPSGLEVWRKEGWQPEQPLPKRAGPELERLPPPPSQAYIVRGVVQLRPPPPYRILVGEAKDLLTGRPISSERFSLASFGLELPAESYSIYCADGFEVRKLIGTDAVGKWRRIVDRYAEDDGQASMAYLHGCCPGGAAVFGAYGPPRGESLDESEFQLVCVSSSAPAAAKPAIEAAIPKQPPSGRGPLAGGAQARAADKDIMEVVRRWASTARSLDVAGHMTVYADTVDQFYTKRALSKAAVEAEVAAIFRANKSLELELSNFSRRELLADFVMVEFDKKYKAVSPQRIATEGKVRSQLILTRFPQGWRIVSEADKEVYWPRRQP
jgi:ketosteroid isomerase-like protein